MERSGPFLREYPMAATAVVDLRWCYEWRLFGGRIVAIEWISP